MKKIELAIASTFPLSTLLLSMDEAKRKQFAAAIKERKRVEKNNYNLLGSIKRI